ncbi:MAG: App1 family protein [Bacteroidota bacterium]
MAHVWQISIIAFSSITSLRGVVLYSEPKKQKNRMSIRTNLIKLINSYTIPPLKNASISIKLNEIEYKVSTNNQGAFSLDLDYSIEKEPNISVFYQGKKLIINQDYPIFHKNSQGNIDVISDIDDTLIVSHTATAIKRIGTLAMVSPHKRKTIEFTEKIINYLKKNHAGVFYVSKSESNLFGVLSSFIEHNKLPKGFLLLTPYLNFVQLLKGKKGKDFKIENISFIIENSGDEKFVLFGDDTQKDMKIYTKIAKYYPDRISKIYIRQTKTKINKRKQMYWENLKSTFPKSVYFNKETDINAELKSIDKLFKKQ